MENITAVILAAGLGTRMKTDVPKVLHRIGSETILGRVIQNLKKAGINDIIAVVGYKADIVESFFADAIRGPDYTDLGTDRLGNPPLASVEWHNTSYGLKASYQVINDLFTWFSIKSSNIGGDIRCSPDYFYGHKNSINFGTSFGF